MPRTATLHGASVPSSGRGDRGAARRFHHRVPQRRTSPPKTAQRTWRRAPWTGRLGHRRPQLLERAHLDLPNAFARHAELVGQRLQRQRLARQTARFKDPAFGRRSAAGSFPPLHGPEPPGGSRSRRHGRFGAQPVSPAIRISSAPPAALRRRYTGAHPLRPISIMCVAVRSIPLAHGAPARRRASPGPKQDGAGQGRGTLILIEPHFKQYLSQRSNIICQYAQIRLRRGRLAASFHLGSGPAQLDDGPGPPVATAKAAIGGRPAGPHAASRRLCGLSVWSFA